MTFKTDGSSHRGGVKSENKIVSLMQSSPEKAAVLCNIPLKNGGYTVVRRGGTKYKEDFIVCFPDQKNIKISHKHKKRLTSGSFDFVNTSGHPLLSNLKELSKNLRKGSFSVCSARNKFNAGCKSLLDTMTSDEIIQILRDCIVKPYSKIDRISIESAEQNTIFSFDPQDLPLFNALKMEGVNVELTGRGKTSRMIKFFDKEKSAISVPSLRIRVCSNNGIKAMLGINPKGKNNNSTPVIKIQQDSVHKLVENISAAGKLTKVKV
tara:strand:- start:12 stop:806 length:795 start_codon:yes stop_codon:yes gene_type:complete